MAMNMKMATGARAATISWGRYLPKKFSSFSTPSAMDSITSPVRVWSK